jgi:hypothetical protein
LPENDFQGGGNRDNGFMELRREKLITFISRHWGKCFLGFAATVAGLVFIPQIYLTTRPLEDQLFNAERLELYREAHPADGGSVVFFFRLHINNLWRF